MNEMPAFLSVPLNLLDGNLPTRGGGGGGGSALTAASFPAHVLSNVTQVPNMFVWQYNIPTEISNSTLITHMRHKSLVTIKI